MLRFPSPTLLLQPISHYAPCLSELFGIRSPCRSALEMDLDRNSNVVQSVVGELSCTLFRRNWRYTLTYWSAFFSFGLCVALLGPTVLDLRCQTRSTLQQVTFAFFSQQLCLFVGSFVGGFLNPSLFCSLSSLAASTFIISVVFAFIPLCSNLLMLIAAMAVTGLAMGIIDTISNLQLVKIYQKDSTVFLQALHFFVGLGALLSPLIADPFLSDTDCIIGNTTSNTTTPISNFRNKLVGRHLQNVSQISLNSQGEVVTDVSYAFWIMALVNLPVPIAVMFLMYRERFLQCCTERSPRLLDMETRIGSVKTLNSLGSVDLSLSQSQEHIGHGNILDCYRLSKMKEFPLSFFGIHVLGGMVLFFYDGIVGSYTGFVYSYAVAPPMNLPHKTAGYLTSVFWAAITLGRLASILLTYRIKPVHLLTVNQVGVIVTQFLLLVLYTNSVFLFIGTSFLGLFISSIYPCLLAFTEDILNYKGCATTVLVTCAGMGEMLLQLLVGSVIHPHGSYNFMMCGMIFGCMGFMLFLALLLVNHKHKKLAAALDASPAAEKQEPADYTTKTKGGEVGS